MKGTAPRAGITGVPGWETPAEQTYLVDLAHDVKPEGVIVEIGAEYGMSASLFCFASRPSVIIHSIDLFPDDLALIHAANLAEVDCAQRVIQWKGDSKDLALHWSIPIDLLFVDGDHSYEGAHSDLLLWSGYVKPSGVIAVHDCACATNKNPHPLHFEVQRAVDDWFRVAQEFFVELRSVDSIRAFKRKEGL